MEALACVGAEVVPEGRYSLGKMPRYPERHDTKHCGDKSTKRIVSTRR